MAQDAAAGRTTRIYLREHSSDLFRAASQIEAFLKGARTLPALEPQLRQLAALAGRISADLDRLGGASKEEELGLARELQAAAQAIQAIGQGLE